MCPTKGLEITSYGREIACELTSVKAASIGTKGVIMKLATFVRTCSPTCIANLSARIYTSQAAADCLRAM